MRFLTLTLHPCIDRVIEVERWAPGGTFDGRLKLSVPSGKGVNTARSLRGLLGRKDRSKIYAAAWVGEGEAAWFERQLQLEDIAFSGMLRPCLTSTGTTLLEAGGRETHVKEAMTSPSGGEQMSMLQGCCDLPNTTIAAVCGSAPAKTSLGMLGIALALLRSQTKHLIADTHG